MPSIKDVANFFISKSKANTSTAITPLKLQKLVYYAQGWHLGFTGESLFEEELEAWVHGPVNSDLYQKYRDFGYNSIQPINFPEADKFFSKQQLDILEAVWEGYGGYNGKYLEELTHSEKPWLEARGDYHDNERSNKVIEKQTIKEYFKTLV